MRRAEKSSKADDTLASLLNLWKNADPNLPLLKHAKAEFTNRDDGLLRQVHWPGSWQNRQHAKATVSAQLL